MDRMRDVLRRSGGNVDRAERDDADARLAAQRKATGRDTARSNGAAHRTPPDGRGGLGDGREVVLLEREIEEQLDQLLGRSAGATPQAFLQTIEHVFPLQENGELSEEPVLEGVSLIAQLDDGMTAQQRSLLRARLGGRVSAAQASLSRQAKLSADDALAVLKSLTPIAPAVDSERVEALRKAIQIELTELVALFGRAGRPVSEAVDLHFEALRGKPGGEQNDVTTFGIQAGFLDRFGQPTDANVAGPDDESQVAGFRLLRDYIETLQRNWDTYLKQQGTASLGTRRAGAVALLPIIGEANAAWKQAMDEVGFPDHERRSTLGLLTVVRGKWDFSIADLSDWIARLAGIEGRTLLADAGDTGLQFLRRQAGRIVEILQELYTAKLSASSALGRALDEDVVLDAMTDLQDQLRALAELQ